MVDMVDPYRHQSINLYYSSTKILGPGCQETLFSTSLAGCVCTTTCSTACSHYTQYGANYDAKKLVMIDSARPVVECNAGCTCEPSTCRNRVVQDGPSKYLQVV